MVTLQSVFVRDHQRRLRLVIDLLEEEAHRQQTFNRNHRLKHRNVSITLRHLGEKFRLQEEAPRPFPTAAAGG